MKSIKPWRERLQYKFGTDLVGMMHANDTAMQDEIDELRAALQAPNERDYNLHLFLSHFEFGNDAMTVQQVLDNWKTDEEQIARNGAILRGFMWPERKSVLEPSDAAKSGISPQGAWPWKTSQPEMKSQFWKFFNSAPHRKKYSDLGNDHPVVIGSQEAWDRAVEDAVIICNAVATQAYHQGNDHLVAKECARQIADILKDKSAVDAVGGIK